MMAVLIKHNGCGAWSRGSVMNDDDSGMVVRLTSGELYTVRPEDEVRPCDDKLPDLPDDVPAFEFSAAELEADGSVATHGIKIKYVKGAPLVMEIEGETSGKFFSLPVIERPVGTFPMSYRGKVMAILRLN